MHPNRFFIPLVATLLLSTLPATAAEDDARQATEAVVREYILAHPEVLVEAMNKYYTARKADEAKVAQAAVLTHRADLLEDQASPSAGNPNDEATVVEFFDYRCGFCRKASPAVVKLASGNKVRVVFKELPILGPESVALAKAGLAAHRQGVDLYLKFHEAMMASQETVNIALAERIAAQIGLDMNRWRADRESPEVQAALERNSRLAGTLSIEATPTFFVGNQRVPGAVDEAELNGLIARIRNNKSQQLASAQVR